MSCDEQIISLSIVFNAYQESLDTENGDRETKRANGNFKDHALSFPVDGSHGPSNTNAKEHIDSIWACDIAYRGISSVILDGSGFAGKGI